MIEITHKIIHKKNAIVFMRNYAYNIINKSGKESICEKQEY